MKKKVLGLLLILIVPLCLTGCGSEDNKTESNKQDYTFENLKTDLTALDSNIEINQKSAEMLGAEEGYGYIMSDCTIEVYKFDKSSSAYKTDEKDQKLSMPSLDMSFDATVKNGYAYMITDGTCDQTIKYVEKLN